MANTELGTALDNNAAMIGQLIVAVNDDNTKVVALPDGVRLEALEKFSERKQFSKEQFITTDLDSFLAYVNYRAIDFLDSIGSVNTSKSGEVTACVWFGRDKGYGQGRNKAEFVSELESEVEAVLALNNRVFGQQNFVLAMEVLPFVTFFDSDGNDMSFDQALSRLSSLTTEQAKVSKSVVGDFAYELSNLERAMVQDMGSLPVGFRLDTNLFRGTKLPVQLVAKISVIIKGDDVAFNLRIPELDVVRQAKVKEVVSAIHALSIPTFFGNVYL